MFAAHLLPTADSVDLLDVTTWDAIVNGRSSILFATLAGVSIGLVTGGSHALPAPALSVARGRLAVRAGVLFVLGILLTLTGVPVYVILQAYAILFLLTLPFTRLRARTLFAIAAGIGAVVPFLLPSLNALPIFQGPLGQGAMALLGWHYPFPLWLAFLLAGLGLARAGITRVAVQVRMLVGGAVVSIAGYSLAFIPALLPAGTAVLPSADPWAGQAHSSGIAEAFGSGGFAVAVIGACLLVCRTPARWLVLPLRALGAMPLTAYVAQLVIWAIAAAVMVGDVGDLFAFRDLEPFWPLTLGMLVACTLWALLLGRGPLEWLLDRAAKRAVRA